jgi:hypothetical protein
MIDPRINPVAVLVAAVAAMVPVGAWYMGLSEPYLEHLGKTQVELDRGPSMAVAMTIQLACNVVTAFVIAWFVARTGAQTARRGLKIALAAWVGFVACVLAPMYAFQAYSFAFFVICSLGVLIAFMTMGPIVGGWHRRATRARAFANRGFSAH